MSFKSTYASKLLDKKSRKLKRDTSAFSFPKAQNVGILWHVDDLKAFEYMKTFMEGTSKKVTSLCYVGKNGESIGNSFGDKGTNWLGFPKTEMAKGFMQEGFDLLVNVSLNNSFSLQAVAALSKAKFKIGAATKGANYNDLSIDVGKKPDSMYLAEQQVYYLKELKINN